MSIGNPATETLQGAIERVTFHQEETGFCVLRVQVKGQRDLVTVIGNTAAVHAGEFLECHGTWINDKKHGLQFKASQLAIIPPTTLAGIEKYLASGMVKGVGPHFAKKLVQAFGEAVFDVIEAEPERLKDIEGIGPKRTEKVIAAWGEQKAIRGIMVFLHSHGVGSSRSVRIYKTYGDTAIETVRTNPYRLALDIRGIGFKTADQLAMRLGIDNQAPIRAQAGVRHVVQELCDDGHCAVPIKALLAHGQTLLDMDSSLLEAAINHEVNAGHLVTETLGNESCVYLAALYQAETRVATLLSTLKQGQPPWGEIAIEPAICWVEKQTGINLSASQKAAIATVCAHKVTIITGGPGVGKTTLVNSVLQILRAKHCRLQLCAPTGRAAKRLTETTGLEAKTIHRLLAFDPKRYAFSYDQDKPLPLDVLIVDEASMIDIVLFYHLLKAIPPEAAIIIVGDKDQLPSVGPGRVLADMIESQAIPTVYLTEIFRQAAHSQIIVNAHRVNQGKLPVVADPTQSDFFVLYRETPEEVHDTIISLVTHRLPNHYHCRPIDAIQVLTPMNRGGVGSRGLNATLQQALNGDAEPKVTRFGSTYAPGDKVIQMTNNYDKEVFNGDIGVIDAIDLEDGEVAIRFDSGVKSYAFHELDEINLAYAISIHKSQGSEFPIIVIPLVTAHYTLLARNLIYTAITRGKQVVVLIGQKKAIGMAVRNQKESRRLTHLSHRINVLP